MRRTKVIITIIIALLLVGIMLVSLVACDLGNNQIDNDNEDNGGGGEGGGGEGGGEGGGGSGGTVKPPRPPKPPTTSDESGISSMEALARLIGGSKAADESEGKYRILNLSIDMKTISQGEADVGHKRLVIRTNVDTSGTKDSEVAIKLIDLTNADKEPANPSGTDSGTTDPDDDDDDDTLDDNSGDATENPGDVSISYGDSSGSVTVAATVTVNSIKEEIAYEEKGELQWAFYVLGDKLYMQSGDDENQPLLYFEDFNMDYVNAIVKSLLASLSDGNYDGNLHGPIFNMLDDMIGLITINDIVGMVVTYLFLTPPTVTQTEDENGNIIETYKIPIALNSFINSLDQLLQTAMTALSVIGIKMPSLAVGPLMAFLDRVTPKMDINIYGTIVKTKQEDNTYTNKTTGFILQAKDNDTESATFGSYLLDMSLLNTITYWDGYLEILPQSVHDATNWEPFSLTNIALSIDILLDTNGDLDIGNLINSFAGKVILPENTIIANAATGFRLELALDADLNYGRKVYVDENGNEKLVDNNYLALELFLIRDPSKDKANNSELSTDDEEETVNRLGYESELVDEEPLICAYYMEGGLYINVDHLLENYYKGNNLKLNLNGLPEIVEYVVNLVTKAMDGAFADTLHWDVPTWDSLYGNSTTDNGQSGSIDEEEDDSVLKASDINVVSLATNERGEYVVNLDFVDFLKAVGAVIGLGDIFSANDEQTAIEITVNTVLFDALEAFLQGLEKSLGFELPAGIIATLGVNFDTDGSLCSITVAAGVDARVGYVDYTNDTWYVGNKVLFKDLAFTNDFTSEEPTYYSDPACTEATKITLNSTKPLDSYDIVYIKDNKYYIELNNEGVCSNEVAIGYDPNRVLGAYKNGTSLGITLTKVDAKNWQISNGTTPIKSKSFKAYTYKGTWVVGVGLDDGDYLLPKTTNEEDAENVKAKGLTAIVAIHDIMIGKTSDYLDKFDSAAHPDDPTKTNYKGVMGAKSNLEGYILSKTHGIEQVTLDSQSTGRYLVRNDAGDYERVELGTGAGKTAFDPEASYYAIVENPYVDSIGAWIDTLLAGTFLSLNIAIDFKAGKYNIAPLISLFLSEMADQQLIWEFTGDFTLDASLNIGIALDKETPSNSKIVLEVRANKDLMIAKSYKPGKQVVVADGETLEGEYYLYNEEYDTYVLVDLGDPAIPGKIAYDSTKKYYEYNIILFEENSVILGVYGDGDKIYAKLDNIQLLNIVLPNLSLQLDYTSLLFSLLENVELPELTLDIMGLIAGDDDGNGGSGSGSNDNNSGDASTGSEGSSGAIDIDSHFTSDISKAVALMINSDVVAAKLTIAGLQSLLNLLITDPDSALKKYDFASVMDVALALVLDREKGTYLDITGALFPIYDELTGDNDYSENMHISLRLGTEAEEAVYDGENNLVSPARFASPVRIGDVSAIMSRYEDDFEELAANTSNYYDDLLQAIIQVIGDLQLTITIDASVLNSTWDINKIIDTIVADRADSFGVPINIDFDEWATEVQLAVEWYLDLENFKQTQILIEIRYEGNVWIGIYVYQNSIILDLNGLGLFDVEVKNLSLVSQLGTVITSLLSSAGDLSLTSLVGGLIGDAIGGSNGGNDNGQNNEDENASGQEGENSESEEQSEAGEESGISDELIATILSTLSLQNTTVALHVTADIFEAIFRELLGFSMYLEFDVGASVDIKEGVLELNVGVERSVFADIKLELAAGRRGQYKFEKNLNEIPDWNAVTGEYLIKSILNNLELGLYIDLNQYTSTIGGTDYTRIYIEKVKKTTTLANTDGEKVSKGSILVTIASINEAEFENTGSGTKTPILYVELDYNKGVLNLFICSGVLSIVVDLGDMLSPFAIDLDLVSMLSGTLDGLLQQLSGLVGGLLDDTSNTVTEPLTTTLTGENEPAPEEEKAEEVSDTISVTKVISSYEWEHNVVKGENIGRYFFQNYNVDDLPATDDKGTFYKVIEDANGDPTLSAAYSIETGYTDMKELPKLSKLSYAEASQYVDKIFRVTKTSTDGVVSYEFYMCVAITWKTFGYYQIELVSGISGLFSNFDFLNLFDMIDIYLACDKEKGVGVLNADVTLSSYYFNYLIDNLLYYVFGPETILNLKDLTKDSEGPLKFNTNFLKSVYWDRQNANNFWNDLWDQIKPLLGEVLDGLGYGWVYTLAGGLIDTQEGTVKNLLVRFVPFAVTNESHLGLNLVRGQLTNIYLTNDDNNQAIYDYVLSYDKYDSSKTYYAKNGNKYEEVTTDISDIYARGKYYEYKQYTFNNGKNTLTYNAGSRNANYFTNLYIFNTSDAVGENLYTGRDKVGAVTWDNTPSTITYNPYMYASHSAAATEFCNTYFAEGHMATYQFAKELYKAEITFKYAGTNTAVDATSLQEKLQVPGIYHITASAPFNNGATTETLDITLRVQSGDDETVTLDDKELFVYQEIPAYMFMYTDNNTANGGERRIETSKLQFASDNNGTPDSSWTIKHDYAYVAPEGESDDGQGGWTQKIWVKFPNGKISSMNIHYKNSTITDVIIGDAKDNIINVNLYEFAEGETLASYTPEYLFFKYYDGTADKLKVDGGWTDVGENDIANLFAKVNPSSALYGNKSGGEYKIQAVVASGTQNEQAVVLTFNVKSREVSSVSIGQRFNTLEVQPYEYYLYLIDEDVKDADYSKYNPYSNTITVNYDTYSDQVKVLWGNIIDKNGNKTDYDGNYDWTKVSGINYSWDIDGTATSTAYVGLDHFSYDSGKIFRWVQPVDVMVSRNQIQRIYFDDDSSTLTINPYDYYNSGIELADRLNYYPKTARVQFTNGVELEMPIAWNVDELTAFDSKVKYSTDYTQLTVTIGFDYERYTENMADLVGYSYDGKTPFMQDYVVNVKVVGNAIEGIELDGSEYRPGTTYVIDPVDINLLGQEPFPDRVDVVYVDGTVGKLEVVEWIYDFKIYMSHQSNIYAYCKLANNLEPYPIRVEILDRNSTVVADLTDVTGTDDEPVYLNPYAYTITEDGAFTYDVFGTELDVKFASSYELTFAKVSDETVVRRETFESSTALSDFLNSMRSVYTKATDTYKINGEPCKLTIETKYEEYPLPVYWDTASLDISNEGGISTVKYYLGHDIRYTEVNKNAAYNSSVDYYVLEQEGNLIKTNVYNKANISGFAEGVQYYYISNYEKVTSDMEFDSNKTYYKLVYTYRAVGIKGFRDYVTYYTREGTTYTEVASNATYNSTNKYYVKIAKFEKVNISDFEGDETYYVNYYEIEKSVDVQFSTATVDKIGSDDYVYVLNVNPNEDTTAQRAAYYPTSMISDDELTSGRVDTTMQVFFTNNTNVYMNVTVDLYSAYRDIEGTVVTYPNKEALFGDPDKLTKYNFDPATVGASKNTYYVLGRYISARLRGRDKDNNPRNDLTKTYYKFTEIATADMVLNHTYYVSMDGAFIPVYINNSADISGKYVYYEREIENADDDTVGDYFVLNDNAADRSAYVEIKNFGNTDLRYDESGTITYYSLSISQYYYVRAMVEANSPELRQEKWIKMYILA